MTLLEPTTRPKARGRPTEDDPQRDLFEAETLFPVRSVADVPAAMDFNRRMAAHMSRAIRESGKSRRRIAEEMTELLGYADGRVTIGMLNAYTSQARETHTISLVRFVAFVRVTGATWLWDEILKHEGMTLLRSDEAHFARAGLLEKRGRELLAAAEAARAAAPASVSVGGQH